MQSMVMLEIITLRRLKRADELAEGHSPPEVSFIIDKEKQRCFWSKGPREIAQQGRIMPPQ